MLVLAVVTVQLWPLSDACNSICTLILHCFSDAICFIITFNAKSSTIYKNYLPTLDLKFFHIMKFTKNMLMLSNISIN